MCIRSPWSRDGSWYVMSLFGHYDVTCDLRWLSCSVIAMPLSLPLGDNNLFHLCVYQWFSAPKSVSFHYHHILIFYPPPLLQDVITHALHVCRQHPFGLLLRMNGMHITQFDHARLDLLSLVIWSRVFWPLHVKLKQSTALEQKRFDLRSLSPALRNL